jgi:hypothetical protein
MKQKSIKLLILIYIATSLLSCSRGISYEERMNNAKNEYNLKMSDKSKKLVDSFFNGSLPLSDNKKNIDAGFYCMWKTREIKIEPHLVVNKMFRENGYNITLSQDSLRYIIVSESKSHKVGSYGNGADAVQLEIIVSLIDLKEEKAYRLLNNMGGMPPQMTSNRSGAIGSFLGDEGIYNSISNLITN